jgi:CRISPR system Cascade subunit CasA
MSEPPKEAHFNLWTAPWITLERSGRGTERLGIAATLLRAQEFAAIYDPSPLVIAGIHRLLTAIAQAICDPQRPADLKALWQAGRFAAGRTEAFGARYAGRFDLFSEGAPFLQSADLPLHLAKADKSKLKSVSQLTVETSRSTALEHYRHGRALDEQFCPACAARGLVTIPAFTSSGGRGLKPSINGVPPIHVLPGGESLFKSLAASVALPDYQPAVRARSDDLPWWKHPPMVATGDVLDVGYLHSLTFPARRVRLHPERLNGPCTRCGEVSEWGVRTMVFEMGESRSKEAPFWQDPFAAYRQSGSKKPTPIRPQPGKALWREFAGLLVAQASGNERQTWRPRVLDQIADLRLADDTATYPVRCIGVLTDMKAKVFEWVDAGFEVPPAILRDEDAAYHISRALDFAADCEQGMAAVFRRYFGGKSKKAERNKRLKQQACDAYWAALAEPFRQFVLTLDAAGTPEARLLESAQWADRVVNAAQVAFKQAADAIGDDAANLRQRVQGEDRCRLVLNVKRKKFQTGKEQS